MGSSATDLENLGKAGGWLGAIGGTLAGLGAAAGLAAMVVGLLG
ncbi:hypothetical protein [Prescottella subtropica]|nr:hypothetical protein [Prescottella subtropica]